jgi:hypothetical protein
MISIIQAEPTPRGLQLLRCQTLEGSLRRDGHEHGEVDGTMGEDEDSGAGASRLLLEG